MHTIIALYVASRMAMHDLTDRLTDEEGQTSMEWLGIAAVIVAIVVFLASGPAESMGEAIRAAFERMVGEATGV
jgi:hypothetical protein